jgi:hypothetical protein
VSQPDASNSFPVPHLNRSPARSLRPAPVVFTVAGVDYEIPALPAADWLVTLMQDWVPDDVLIDLVPEGAKVALLLDPEDVEPLVMDLLGEASGRDWWITLRLVAVIQDQWQILGPEMFLQGADPQRLSLAGWLDTMTLVLLRLLPKDSHAMFLSQLEMPPEALRAEVMEEMEMSVDQFMTLARG